MAETPEQFYARAARIIAHERNVALRLSNPPLPEVWHADDEAIFDNISLKEVAAIMDREVETVYNWISGKLLKTIESGRRGVPKHVHIAELEKSARFDLGLI